MILNDELVYELVMGYDYNSPEIYFSKGSENKIPEVFVYASGKTASTSVFKEFQRLDITCVHLHYSKYFVKRVLKLRKWEDFVMMDYINYLTTYNKNILIVDAVREPISRKISAFFQHFNKLDFASHKMKSKEQMLEYYDNNIEVLINKFNNTFLLQSENYYSFDEYIDDGLDVRNIDFNHTDRCIYHRHNEKNYLILRFEDTKYWNDIFNNIGYEDFSLPHENEATKKRSADILKKFKENYHLPKSKLDTIYFEKHKDVLTHFYTSKEIQSFYNKWLKIVE